MPTFPKNNHDTYCYLKQSLEPDFQVITEPQLGYFGHWKFCYRIIKAHQVVAELQGDFRDTSEGDLIHKARAIVNELCPETIHAPGDSFRDRRKNHQAMDNPIASRLPPLTDNRTWFSSGRAAFTWLLCNIVRPRRVFLPTYICWSLVDALLHRFPNITLDFYPVTRTLNRTYPTSCTIDDAIVNVHYFGHTCEFQQCDCPATILDDRSHCLLDETSVKPGHYCFGSLRKAYRVADGGYVAGHFNPNYESDTHSDAWLRLAAKHWTDLREAENMLDREFRVSDISSQSLAVILKTQPQLARDQRRANNSFLNDNMPCGKALLDFTLEESPLLHSRWFDSEDERDSLRSFLADRKIFTSIHWPVHEHLKQRQDTFDIEDALWLEQHTLALPISEHLSTCQMDYICKASAEWQQAGGSRFPLRSTG